MFYNLFFKNINKQKSVFSYRYSNKISISYYNNINTSLNGLNLNEIFNLFHLLCLYLVRKNKHKNMFIFINTFISHKFYFSAIRYNINYFSRLIHILFFNSYNKYTIPFSLYIQYHNSIDNSFVYFKWLEIELLKKYNISKFNLPVKYSKYTLLRSPFVFKKGREQFEKKEFNLIVNYSFFFSNNFFNLFYKKATNSFFIKHKYTSLCK